MTETERDPWLDRLAEEDAVLMPLPYKEPSPIFKEMARLLKMSRKELEAFIMAPRELLLGKDDNPALLSKLDFRK